MFTLLASAVESAASTVAASATAEEQKDNPQTAIVAAATAAKTVAASATAEEQKDNPQTVIVAKAATALSASSYIRLTATSTVRST